MFVRARLCVCEHACLFVCVCVCGVTVELLNKMWLTKGKNNMTDEGWRPHVYLLGEEQKNNDEAHTMCSLMSHEGEIWLV